MMISGDLANKHHGIYLLIIATVCYGLDGPLISLIYLLNDELR